MINNLKKIIRNHPFVVMILLLPPVFAISLLCGDTNLFNPELSSIQLKVIVELRMTRALTAFSVGGALAVAGLAYQAVLRNPLAEPFILGISGGSGVGAAIAIISGLAAMSSLAIPAVAFLSSLIVLALVLAVAGGQSSAYTTNIMLSGIIIGTVCSSMMMFIISTLGVEDLNSITWWMLGNLQALNPRLLICASILAPLGTFILFIFGREANVISLGEDMAWHFGISPKGTVYTLLGIASLLTAASVSLAGIIGFVGLIVPHILRSLFGADHRRLFPLGLFGGGMFLILCDTISRSILPAQDVPVGVITASLGGPFFLWLLNRKRRDSHK